VPESPLPPSPYPRSPRRGPQHRTSPRLRAPGSAGVPRVGAGPGRRRRAGARPAPGPCRALGSRPWGSGCPIPRARPRPAWRLEPRAGGAGRSDPGDPADSRKRGGGGGGGRRGRRFLAPPGASRQPSEPCQRPGPPFPAPSHDEDLVQRQLRAQRARQKLLPHGGAGRLAGGQELHRLPLPQRPLRRPVHTHHRGLPPQSLQHPWGHVPAGHPGHVRQPPLPRHAQALHPYRLKDVSWPMQRVEAGVVWALEAGVHLLVHDLFKEQRALAGCWAPGDVFILVFSLDNRESFDEVKRLQKQILEVKSCLKNKTKEAAELPMVICGNKNDHGELCRQVPATEAELLVSGDENCAYFEVSAKKNTNVDEMFYVLFSMAKLPHEMSPALHRKISVQYGDAFHPRPFCMRRVKEMDAYGMVSPFARRPSVNSDLKYIKAKVLREGQARERDKCTIQ
uniref:RASD family member 2 n=1 Tax=Equus caballus TaxID=9796 RepID=A0A3Q2I8V2_HORSE